MTARYVIRVGSLGRLGILHPPNWNLSGLGHVKCGMGYSFFHPCMSGIWLLLLGHCDCITCVHGTGIPQTLKVLLKAFVPFAAKVAS